MVPLQRIRVVLADDHALVRSGIRALLGDLQEVDVVGEAGDGGELLALLADDPPDLVITDLSMPGMDGLTAVAHIRDEFPAVRVLVLSMNDTLECVTGAVRNGACGYLMKNAAPQELAHAVRSVMEEGRYFGSAVAELLLLQPPAEGDGEALTQRQREILVLLANGLSSREIGSELGLSAKTVDVHRSRIMERLNLRDVASLTRYALRKGLVEP
jgi:DNA-binding NarL/FixJ family response regulator